MYKRASIVPIAMLFLSMALFGQPTLARGKPQPVNTPPPTGRSLWYIALAKPEWLTVIVASLTCIVVGWQSWQTKVAAQATRMSAEGVYEQLKATQDRERARISIYSVDPPEFGPPSVWNGSREVPVTIRINVINDGDSKAFNVEAIGWLQIHEKRGEPFNPIGINLDIPRVIRTQDPDRTLKVSVTGPAPINGAFAYDFTTISEAMAEGVRDTKKFLRIMGRIAYEDVFGRKHETPFDYLWKVHARDSTNEWPEGSQWSDLSPSSF